MSLENNALSLLKKNNGYLSAEEARKEGITNTTLLRMEKREIIERVAHGLYMGVEYFPDRYFIAQYRCSKSVFSHLTALYLHGYSDRVPIKLTMTVPLKTRTKHLSDEKVVFYYNSQKFMELGLVDIKTEYGMIVKAFDIERTICDCLKHSDKMDYDLVLSGMKQYLKSKQRNSVKLLEYATEFNIRDVVRRYLEVL